MIAQIEGKLIAIEEEKALVKVSNVCYEVMLPGYAVSQLADKLNHEITLCTLEYYEGTPGGGNLIPRMVGFLSRAEKDFFAKYTSVKGMGIKKGLKSLTIPISTIASAIETGDEKMLLSLPAVGKRFAQLIIAQLKGKLADFAVTAEMAGESDDFKPYQLEALEILIAWGEKRNEAVELINKTSRKHPEAKSAEQLVPLVYRLKQGMEM